MTFGCFYEVAFFNIALFFKHNPLLNQRKDNYFTMEEGGSLIDLSQTHTPKN